MIAPFCAFRFQLPAICRFVVLGEEVSPLLTDIEVPSQVVQIPLNFAELEYQAIEPLCVSSFG